MLLDSDFEVLTVSNYLDGTFTNDVSNAIIIDNFDDMIRPSMRDRMGELRVRIFDDVQNNGSRYILLSRSPRIAFPAVVGSSLLEDASFSHAPNPRLTDVSNWPACVQDGSGKTETVVNVIRELGIEVCTSLDKIVYEHRLSADDALQLLTPRESEALDGAGITMTENSVRYWNISPFLNELKVALDEVLAESVDPQLQFVNVSQEIWKLERLIRQGIRTQSISVWGHRWKKNCLHGDLGEKVLRRASESAYIDAKSVSEIRDPLEWLSLGELLEVRNRKEIGLLGLTKQHWNNLERDVLPIRNRFAHLRHLTRDDVANVIKWRRMVSDRLIAGK